MYYKYLNNKLVLNSVVSTDDRGFKYGDGVFEIISIFNSTLYLWEYHMERLIDGLNVLRIKVCDSKDLYNKAHDLIHKNFIKDGLLKIIITRGSMDGGYEVNNLVGIDNSTTLIEILDVRNIIEKQVKLCVSSWRKPSVQSLPIYIKTLQGLNSILSRIEAKDNDCFEAILLNDKEYVCEVSSGNIFWTKNEIIYTPHVKNGLLPGIIRRRIIELSPFKIVQGNYKLSEILNADSMFITNISWIALPVRKVKLNKGEKIMTNSDVISNKIVRMIIKDKFIYSQNTKTTYEL